MKIILDDEVRQGAIRVDRAWELFFDSKTELKPGGGLFRFPEWLWDEFGRKAGNLNKNTKGELSVTIPQLDDDALDFLLRLASFWGDEVYVKKGGRMSENLWREPVVNLFEDQRKGAERALAGEMDDAGSTELNLMPIIGPGRAFFSVQVLEEGGCTARLHSHSEVDEYYLILEGKGTLRHNDKEIEVKRGDIIGKPTGPDNATQLVADRGERLRILDMEVWHQRAHFSKDLMLHPEFNELIMRGPGWGAIIPRDSMITSEDFRSHYDEGYRRNKDGGWVPARHRGHKKVREEKK